ncbi:unnamed protein product [Darwinula stevensoni]|uniref:Uncharacterized protein n=1 Tax=Darwinula stevensoni TaxID=69355 RepID=A0A7R9A7X6_9CRUS|nr:unnamed protein product [Darwinula stevensoni]CAG0895540.1 unnamed protein product [Darwinula stevensoni]
MISLKSVIEIGRAKNPAVNMDLQTWDTIRKNRMKLRDEYNIDHLELLRYLSDKGVFNEIQVKQVKGKEEVLVGKTMELLKQNPLTLGIVAIAKERRKVGVGKKVRELTMGVQVIVFPTSDYVCQEG